MGTIIAHRFTAPARVLFTVLLLLVPPLVPATNAQVTRRDLPGYDLADAERLLQASLALFHSSRQEESIPGFSDIIDTIKRNTPADALSPAERGLLLTCYEHRARALFNQGRTDESGHDLRSLLSLDPGRQLDPDQVSPKLMRLFDAVRGELIGSVTVSTVPPLSPLIIDGEERGTTDGEPVHLFAGSHRIEVRRPGYDPWVQVIELGAGEQLELRPVELLRTMATCKFITVPARVSVFIDGELVGVTGDRPSPEARQAARDARVNPLDVSDFLLVPDITPGAHRVEFRKECHVPLTRELNFGQPIDYVDSVRRLEPSEGTIVVRAVPPESTISLDGTVVGTGDQLLEHVCSGEHRIEASHGGGRFSTTVTVNNGGRVEVTTVLRPTLAFAGAFPRLGFGGGGEDLARVRSGLAGVGSLNLGYPAESDVDKIFQRFGINPAQSPPEELPVDLLASLGRRLECNLLLLIVRDGERRELRLYSTRHPAPEIVPLDGTGLNRALLRLAAKLDTEPELGRPWTGLLVADVPLATGYPVIGVTAGSPAADAGVHLGDVVAAVDGRRMTGAAMLRSVVADTGTGGTLEIQLNRDGRGVPLSLRVGRTPILLPPFSDDFLYNRMLESLASKLDAVAPGSDEDLEIRLNLAICLLHFNQPDRAAAILEQATTARTAGISQGTVSYYLARCAAESGRTDRADRLYADVIKHPDATLVDHEGPPAWIAVTGLFSTGGAPAP